MSTACTEKVGGREGLDRSGVCENQFAQRSETPTSSVHAPERANPEDSGPGPKIKAADRRHTLRRGAGLAFQPLRGELGGPKPHAGFTVTGRPPC